MNGRLEFIEQRDGLESAVKYAEQTMNVYRKAVLTSRKRGYSKPHHASLPEYRRSFIKAYCECKQYLARHKNNC